MWSPPDMCGASCNLKVAWSRLWLMVLMLILCVRWLMLVRILLMCDYCRGVMRLIRGAAVFLLGCLLLLRLRLRIAVAGLVSLGRLRIWLLLR